MKSYEEEEEVGSSVFSQREAAPDASINPTSISIGDPFSSTTDSKEEISTFGVSSLLVSIKLKGSEEARVP